jgi:hypothetical protein
MRERLGMAAQGVQTNLDTSLKNCDLLRKSLYHCLQTAMHLFGLGMIPKKGQVAS